MSRRTAFIEPLLSPFAGIYSGLMRARNTAYDRKWLNSYEVKVPVVSIGNLTAGGTGKTPLTACLIEGLRARGIRSGVISRGYGGSEPGPTRVLNDGSVETAKRFGDEPSWFAARFQDMPVYVCADRVAAARKLLDAEKVDVIFADDAFQHRRLARALDFVVLDATEPDAHYRSLPLGRMREGFSSLARADAVFITKTNLVSESQVGELKQRIAEQTPADIYLMKSAIIGFSSLASGAAAPALNSSTGFSGKKVVLASGIGRPETFAQLVEENGAKVLKHFVFPDHHVFSQVDRATIESSALALGADAIFVTEKDAAKLAQWSPSVPCWVSRLEMVSVNGDFGEVYETIARLIL